MRFRATQNGLEVTVITSSTALLMSFNMDKKDTGDLMGFAVEETDPTTKKKKWFLTEKYFAPAAGQPAPKGPFESNQQPLQTFYWEDFTVTPGTTYRYAVYPVHGKACKLGKPCKITVTSEPETAGTHSVHFNRGVTGSFAYAREFKNKTPQQMTATELKKALKWLSRGLYEALQRFIEKAKDDTWKIRAAVYEFEYQPVLKLLQERANAGVDIKIVYDSRKEAGANDAAIKEAKLSRKLVIRRTQNPNLISHNKFFILLKNDVPVEVWTGSTNITVKGIYGQCNTGHIIRDKQVAATYLEYWKVLSKDPELKGIKAATQAIQPDLDAADIPQGVTCFFSPREKITMAETYAGLIANAKEMVCGMFPFSFYESIKKSLTADSPAVKYAIIDKLSEKQRPKDFDMKHIKLVYGTYMEKPFFNWLEEVNSGQLFNKGGNKAIGTNYIHNKVILIDPLGEDPIVITGSANYSKNSTLQNDENTVIIRGDKRVADMYFCEFNRIFNHYYSRYLSQLFANKAAAAGETNTNHFLLKEQPSDWVPAFFDADNVKSIRRDLFSNMKV